MKAWIEAKKRSDWSIEYKHPDWMIGTSHLDQSNRICDWRRVNKMSGELKGRRRMKRRH